MRTTEHDIEAEAKPPREEWFETVRGQVKSLHFGMVYAPYDSPVPDARVWLNRAKWVANIGDNPEGIRLLFKVVWKF